MKLALEHDWDLTPAAARELQARLCGRVRRDDALGPVHTVAGVDVGFRDRGRVTHAAVVVLSMPGLAPLESVEASLETRFPYVPGLLSFREVPAVLAALARLETPPDLILCDGHGLAHPRRFGIACHLGVLLDRPTIGVGKSRLVGEHDEVPALRGQWTPLVHREETIGAVLRSREGVKPIYVSTGHRVSLQTSVTWVMRCVTRYRLPETTRHADRLASSPL